MPLNTTTTEHNQPGTVFYEDFSSSVLDRSRWNVRITGHTVNNEQQAYVDSSNTIYIDSGQSIPGTTNGGALVLHPRYRSGFVTPEGKSFDFISARIDTRDKFDFMYGTAAARMRLPSGTGFWPAFWAMGKSKWPDTGEIDIMESIGEADWTSAAVHGPGYSGENGLVNKLYFPTENDATAWHIYSVDWSPGQMVFHVDDVLTFRVTAAMIDFFGGWAFDNPKYLILNFALGGTYPFKFNGVRSPYHGLPEQTVEKIKADQAKVLVDWVRVTKLGY